MKTHKPLVPRREAIQDKTRTAMGNVATMQDYARIAGKERKRKAWYSYGMAPIQQKALPHTPVLVLIDPRRRMGTHSRTGLAGIVTCSGRRNDNEQIHDEEGN